MKYILIILFFNIIFCAYRGLSVNDYQACEFGYKAVSNGLGRYNFNNTTDENTNETTYEMHNSAGNGDDCNARWQPNWLWENQDDVQAYPDYACCYVSYKMRSTEMSGCYLVENTKKKRKDYKERVLDQFSKVKIKCASSYLKIGAFILIFSLIF